MSDESTPVPAPVQENERPSQPTVSKPKKVRNFMAHFQQNRSFELHIAGRMHSTWTPFESKQLTEDIVSHPDFLHYKEMGFFSVQEV